MKLRVGVDLGGMSAKLGVVNENNEIVDRKVIPTEKGITFEETIAKLADGILSLGDVGIGGSAAPDGGLEHHREFRDPFHSHTRQKTGVRFYDFVVKSSIIRGDREMLTNEPGHFCTLLKNEKRRPVLS